jgi:transcriptional regulator with XRE-family HTH domain
MDNHHLIIGKRIKRLRKSIGMTQKDLGEKLGLAISTISGYELGTSEPDIDTINRMSKIFDCSTDYILGNVGNPQHKIVPKEELPPELSKYVDHIAILKEYNVSDITPEELKHAIEFAKKIKGK